ncbi:MAG: hypothetical protein FWC47_12695 [Oscillospiraceae bacterium]|nr:hypothetical protein [Oscillospiraceae bacterium]
MSSYDMLPLLLIAILFVGSLLLNIFNSKNFSNFHKFLFIGIAVLFVGVSFSMGYIVFRSNTTMVFSFMNYENGNDVIKGINLYVDSFNMILIIMMSIVYFVFVIFNMVNLNEKNRKYYSLMTIFVGSLVLFLMCGDLFVLYASCELMVLAQIFLLRYDRKNEMSDNFKYLIFQILSSLFILTGTMILYVSFKTFNIGGLIGIFSKTNVDGSLVIPNSSLVVISSLALLLSGYSAKLLLMPFHKIMSKMQYNSEFNSSSVTVIGTFIAGIYAIIRISFTLFNGSDFKLQWLFIAWGFLIIIVCAIKALNENKLKKLITYIAISEGGYVILGIGVALISNNFTRQFGAYSVLYQILNMAFFIPLLYFCAEIFEKMMGTDDLDKMASIKYRTSLLVICFIVGIFSIMGFPLFNDFISKWMLYKGLLSTKFAPIMIVSFLCFLLIFISLIKILYAVLMVKNKKDFDKVKMHTSVNISVIFLSIMCIITGLFPQFIIDKFLSKAVAYIYEKEIYLNNFSRGVPGHAVQASSFGDSTAIPNTGLPLGSEITPLNWLFVLIAIGIIIYLVFILIKYFKKKNADGKQLEEAAYDIDEDVEVDGYTASELIWSLNKNYFKYFKIFKKFKTESLNNYCLILLSIFTILIAYVFLFTRLGG